MCVRFWRTARRQRRTSSVTGTEQMRGIRERLAHFALKVLLLGLAALLAASEPAHAGCNLIPGTAKIFNAASGATNRPFAAPGETVEVRVRPCDASPGLGSLATDHVVTVVFTPPSGPKNAVVLTADGSCATNIDAKLSACAGQLGGGAAICVPAAQSDLALVNHNGVDFLRFRFPDTDAKCA